MGISISPDIQSIITSAAQRYGIDPQAMLAIAQIESSGNPMAKNPNSSAGGLFQFIDSTAKQYGLSDKFDPAASADAGARLARDNAAHLRGVLGREPTPGELYLAHQQGAGGAAKLLRDPSARAVDIVGADAVRLNGGNPNMTAAEFASLWMNKTDKVLGGQGSGATPQGSVPTAAPSQGGFISDDAFAAAMAKYAPEMTKQQRMGSVGANLMALDSGQQMSDIFGTAGQLSGLFKKGMI